MVFRATARKTNLRPPAGGHPLAGETGSAAAAACEQLEFVGDVVMLEKRRVVVIPGTNVVNAFFFLYLCML